MCVHCLTHEGILKAIREQVRFARARMGIYELIDFVAVVIGYVLSGEPTLQTFYERLAPFAGPFLPLFSAISSPIAQPFPGIFLFSASPAHAFSGGSASSHPICFPWWSVQAGGRAADSDGCG